MRTENDEQMDSYANIIWAIIFAVLAKFLSVPILTLLLVFVIFQKIDTKKNNV